MKSVIRTIRLALMNSLPQQVFITSQNADPGTQMRMISAIEMV